MYCDRCGAELDRGQAFCSKCGAAVQQTEVNQPVNPAPAYQPAPVQSNSSVPVLAVVCTVLAMLVVGLGLVAGGVVKIGDSKAANVEQAAAKSNSTSEKSSDTASSSKSSESEDVVLTEESSTSTSNASSSTESSQTVVVNNQIPAPAPEPAPSSPTSSLTSSSSSTSSASSGYVLPDSASRYYSVSELSGLDNWTLYIARNEIYARHGRGFVREDLQAYFGSCSWYTRRIEPENFVEANHFNDCEMQNVLTIKSIEESRGSPYL